jgi:hypothetical protein
MRPENNRVIRLNFKLCWCNKKSITGNRLYHKKTVEIHQRFLCLGFTIQRNFHRSLLFEKLVDSSIHDNLQ